MNVKIIRVETGQLIEAAIRVGYPGEMPSIQENWRFNFNKHIKLPNAQAYVLVAKETPKIIEGCLIFQLKNGEVPYMAFVEIAPHNKGNNRKYDHVGGCLIAYAFRQSLIQGQGDYRGMLFFDVHETNAADQNKLMKLYSAKFNARRLGPEGTTMVIMDEGGEELIERFLNR